MMNERIKELMEEAGIYDFVVESMGINEELNKFAELIVRECAGIYDKIDNGNDHLGTDDYLLALKRNFDL
jgi:hypothetical protein